MNAKDILDIVSECSCGNPMVTDKLAKVAFIVATKQKEIDATLARELGADAVAEAIEASE
jgi:hypothetical protein